MSTPAEEAFRNLVAAARAEGGISSEERKVLNAQVLKLGLDPARAREIQAAAEAERPPRLRVPRGTRERLDTLRAVLEVVAADGRVAPKELGLLRALAERLSIRGWDFDGLLRAALRRSSPALDRAFAALKVEGLEEPERMDVPAPRPERPRSAEALRALPFAARLAPLQRSCAGCLLPFTDRNPYERRCRICALDDKVKAWTAGRIETLTGLLFALLLLPVGWAVEASTGLWSWGWQAAWPSSRRRPSLVLLLPALGLSAAVAYLAAGAIVYAARRFVLMK